MSALIQRLTGETREIGRNEPFWLNDSETVWMVQQGNVDIFIVPLLPDGTQGARTHLLRVDQGQIMTGFSTGGDPNGVQFLAAGTNGTSLLKFSMSQLRALALDPSATRELVNWLDRWVESIYAGLPGGLLPRHVTYLKPGAETIVPPGMAGRPEQGVLWTTHSKGKSVIASVRDLVVDAESGMIPSTASAWFEAVEEPIVLSGTTEQVLSGQSIWMGLTHFHKLVHRWAAHILSEQILEEKKRLATKSAAEIGALQSAVSNLSGLLAGKERAGSVSMTGTDSLFTACGLIGKALGIPVQAHIGKAGKTKKTALGNIVKASRIRLRRVVLTGEWWKQDGGPILGFFNESDEPVALLPASSRSYIMFAPAAGRREPVNVEIAASINPVAYTFYRPFPAVSLRVLDLIKFGLHNTRSDIGMVLLLGIGGGLLAMLTPIVIGIIFDSLIPSAAATQLMYLAAGLLIASMVGVTFQVTRGIALLRIEGKSDAAIQGAVWDRLLSLPLTFFRNFTAGDLATRANGINAIRATLSGAVLTSVLSGVFSVFSFGLLFYYSLRLALLAALLVATYVGLSIFISFLTLRFQRPLCDLQGKISGQVLQFITGIAKLRVAGAEVHAYAVWARSFSAQKELHLRSSTILNGLAVCSEIYPILASICVFATIAFSTEHGMSSGRFLAFTAAFSAFLYAMLELGSGAISLLHSIPLYERAKPILDALPEVSDAKADPGELSGRVELSHVNFRYTPDGPLVLKDLSFQINPGEFIAIVGPSGSGKSTLMRLLLGFDRPESGTIYFDGLDLAGLDIQAVRRQFGVVLQHSKLMPGDIYQNIVGSSQLSIDEAWDAARKAGLDEDIEQMPMGMHTVLSEGAGTLSGGQRQRLMIARAIVSKPRILLFDEATSSLDNRTQATVSRSLENLQATRIVIAHRLSTIMNADRILVVQAGRLIQSGNYKELLQQEGPFTGLARRQIA